MKKPKSSRISLGAVAKAAKISKVAASFALRNRPGVSKATRERVLRIAKKIGYAPDARAALAMARIRGAKSKELLPLAWLNTNREKNAWHKYKFLSPYLEGARERALQLGYRLEEIWTQEPGMSMRRISQILYQRGIDGVIVTYPARHLRLRWDHLACVGIGGSLLAPRLHRVMTDSNFNLLLALKCLRRQGYRRIGICFENEVDRFSHHVLRSTAHHFINTSPRADQVPPLFYSGRDSAEQANAARQLAAWFRRYRPQVIVGSTSYLLEWLKMAGARVPEDVGLVHLAKDDDVADWAGIHSHKKEFGATAAEWVIALLQRNELGVPKLGLDTLVRGKWCAGRTLLPSPPRLLNVK
jgi:LacI family transcriptional regulator